MKNNIGLGSIEETLYDETVTYYRRNLLCRRKSMIELVASDKIYDDEGCYYRCRARIMKLLHQTWNDWDFPRDSSTETIRKTTDRRSAGTI
jgi:hypothetical protein